MVSYEKERCGAKRALIVAQKKPMLIKKLRRRLARNASTIYLFDALDIDRI